MPTTDGVIRLGRVSVVTADIAASEEFYRRSFGFERVSERTDAGPSFEDLLGIPGVRARSVVLQLGLEQLELVCYDPPGRSYPRGSAANDAWFQHIAIVVSDIGAAYELLVGDGKMTPISTRGPERLPPNTGSVTVFKFRDPEGHPIELSQFPPGVGSARWQGPHEGGNCRGIDHSAISVAQVDRSLDFYCGLLGMRISARTVNRGAEQDRLDGLANAEVDIVALQPADESSPHIELLGYRPFGRPATIVDVTDISATQLAFDVADLRTVLARLPNDGSIVSRRPAQIEGGKVGVLVRDPDGHLILLQSATGADAQLAVIPGYSSTRRL